MPTPTAAPNFTAPPVRPNWYRWVPSDVEQLRLAEARMLNGIEGQYEQRTVQTPLCAINTIYATAPHHTKNVVLLHGFGFGLAQWVPNWAAMAQHANVYAIDMPGFARSGRVNCDGGGQEAILYFIQTLEEWIKVMWRADPPKIILVGHSFGGFIAGKFALNYPQRIEKLVLVDPFGVNEGIPDMVRAARAETRSPLQKLRNFAAETVFYKISPLAPIRALGPFGPRVLGSKVTKKQQVWQHHTEHENSVVDYLYHCNAQCPTGEKAFSKCVTGLGAGLGDGFVAKFPLVHELPKLPLDIPIVFIYGVSTWIPHSAGYTVHRLRNERFEDEKRMYQALVASQRECRGQHGLGPVDEPDCSLLPPPTKPTDVVHVVARAGHHVYVENANRFNGIIQEVIAPGSRRRGTATTGSCETCTCAGPCTCSFPTGAADEVARSPLTDDSLRSHTPPPTAQQEAEAPRDFYSSPPFYYSPPSPTSTAAQQPVDDAEPHGVSAVVSDPPMDSVSPLPPAAPQHSDRPKGRPCTAAENAGVECSRAVRPLGPFSDTEV